jgi:alkaline phosphatase D
MTKSVNCQTPRIRSQKKKKTAVKSAIYLFSLTLASCATPGRGFLLDVTKEARLDPSQLARSCDLDDEAACLLAGKLAGSATAGALPIAQGMAPPGKAALTALLNETQQPRWFLFERSTLTLIPLSPWNTFSRPHSPHRLEQLLIGNLMPGASYELFVADRNGRLLDHRSFSLFDPDRSHLRFALASCSDDQFSEEQKTQWKDLLRQKPDLILAIGDNTYADRAQGKRLAYADPETLWNRYAETRSALALFRAPRLVPIFAVWDDHDFGMNDGDSTYPHAEEARAVMESFFPSAADNKTLFEGPGVSRALKAAGQLFILFDNRSFRSPNGLPPVCRNSRHPFCRGRQPRDTRNATHFGRLQEDWALSLIRRHGGPTWLISGDQWFGAYHPFESYEGNHPESFASFLGKLESSLRKAARQGRQGTVLFASGDRHLTELMRVRPFRNRTFETFEFTSSPIHARTYPSTWDVFPNKRQIVGEAGVINYSIFNTTTEPSGGAQVEVEARGPGGRTLYRKNLQVKPAFPARQ